MKIRQRHWWSEGAHCFFVQYIIPASEHGIAGVKDLKTGGYACDTIPKGLIQRPHGLLFADGIGTALDNLVRYRLFNGKLTREEGFENRYPPIQKR